MAWLHIQLYSETLRMPVPMEVLVPEPDSQPDARAPVPHSALYLLHGLGEDHTAWMRRTSVERHVHGLPLAVIMPPGYRGWYTDMAYGRDYFQFITAELPAICERTLHLASDRDHRFIAGNGMGGYGALKAGLQAPETFRAAASFSGALDVIRTCERLNPQEAGYIFGRMDALTGSVHDLFAAAERIARTGGRCPQLYQWCGTEDALLEENLRFRDHAIRLGLPLTYEQGPGAHAWKHWDRGLERLLDWLPLPGRAHAREER